ncbi:TlpA family protein disulfide reductase [Microbacterium terrisoli]|jgi:thiol-disulfide isomerase/thioredoxin|uniref:TlpA family protein disulfide reductase n=1 Tax=Microbacterium terrisoli TaxID=3242192 RepID=UPI002803D3A2|nr:TlpA disulfide reductase family protein [Microbacterium protaetiae]
MNTRSRSRRPVLAVAAAALTVALALAGCAAAPRGGADAIPTAAAAAGHVTPAPEAVRAPQVHGTLVDGTEVELASLWTSRPLVVQFTATWCTQCADGEPALRALADDYGDDLLVVHVALDEPADTIQKYLHDNDVVGPVIVDGTGSIWRDYAVAEPPVTALIDTAGGIVKMWPGGATGDDLRSALEKIVTR